MSAEYMHIGIPITNRKPNMVYNEGAKFWVSNVDDYDYKIEYLKFEEGTPFPEEIQHGLTLGLIPLLSPSDARPLYDAYQAAYPRRHRLPVQKKLLAELERRYQGR